MTEHTVGRALDAARRILASAGVEEPLRDARRLLGHRIGQARLLDAKEALGADEAAAFERDIASRAARQPVSQIIGSREFWGRTFSVTSDVLDPRPDTETLVECALAGPAPVRILDLGTGSGAILLTLLSELQSATGVGSDLSKAALEVAARNAEALGLTNRATLLLSDWWDRIDGTFDLVVSNPPYISENAMPGLAPEVRLWEPRMALSPGGDGLDAYRRIADDLSTYLAVGGRALFEIGADQGESVPLLFERSGFATVKLHTDLNKKPRVVEVFH
ncbi:MAG: peptide chain release factor N(5)-glutamine methyltransferase [Pseudomonadota bacterium]